MSTAQQAEQEFRDWERKLEVADRAHNTNVGLSHTAKQKYEQVEREYSDAQNKFRTLENEYRRLEQEKSRVEGDMRRFESDMRRAKQELDAQETNARRVDEQLADAKWKVGDMKAKWERAKTEDRARTAQSKDKGGKWSSGY